MGFDVEESEGGDEAHVGGEHALDERGGPGAFGVGYVGEDVDTAIERELDALDGGGVGEDEAVVAVGFGDYGVGDVGRKKDDLVVFDGAGEDFDGVGAVVDLLVDAGYGGGDGGGDGDGDVIVGDELLGVDGDFGPEGFAGGEDARAGEGAVGDLFADEVGVGERAGDVEYGGEAPAGEHGLEHAVELGGGVLLGVEELRRKEVDVAVPEAGGDGEAGAVVGGCVARGGDGGGGAYRDDAVVVDEDGGVVEGWGVGRGVDGGVG